MRDITAKSVKLNRDLDKMLQQALERDLLVGIGWGKQETRNPRTERLGLLPIFPKIPEYYFWVIWENVQVR